MRSWGILKALLLSLAAVIGCSGSVVSSEPAGSDAGADAPDAAAAHDTGADRQEDVIPDMISTDVFGDYVDPGCPDAAAPVFDFACDPLAPPGQCAENESCYPYVDYPADPCAAEVYGAFCYPAGLGTQGGPCYSPVDCAAGFVCVVSGAGNQCVRICSLSDPWTCSDGRVCEPLDVAGVGGCI